MSSRGLSGGTSALRYSRLTAEKRKEASRRRQDSREPQSPFSPMQEQSKGLNCKGYTPSPWTFSGGNGQYMKPKSRRKLNSGQCQNVIDLSQQDSENMVDLTNQTSDDEIVYMDIDESDAGTAQNPVPNLDSNSGNSNTVPMQTTQPNTQEVSNRPENLNCECKSVPHSNGFQADSFQAHTQSGGTKSYLEGCSGRSCDNFGLHAQNTGSNGHQLPPVQNLNHNLHTDNGLNHKNKVRRLQKYSRSAQRRYNLRSRAQSSSDVQNLQDIEDDVNTSDVGNGNVGVREHVVVSDISEDCVQQEQSDEEEVVDLQEIDFSFSQQHSGRQEQVQDKTSTENQQSSELVSEQIQVENTSAAIPNNQENEGEGVGKGDNFSDGKSGSGNSTQVQNACTSNIDDKPGETFSNAKQDCKSGNSLGVCGRIRKIVSYDVGMMAGFPNKRQADEKDGKIVARSTGCQKQQEVAQEGGWEQGSEGDEGDVVMAGVSRRKLVLSCRKIEEVINRADELRNQGNLLYQQALARADEGDQKKGLQECLSTYYRAADVIRSSSVAHKPQVQNQYAVICNNLSAVFLQLHDFQQAKLAAEAACKVDPSYLKAKLRLATCFLRLADFCAAKQLLENSENPTFEAKMKEVKAAEDAFTSLVHSRDSCNVQSLETYCQQIKPVCAGWCDLKLVEGEIAVLKGKLDVVQNIVNETVRGRDQYQQSLGFLLYLEGLFHCGNWDRLLADMNVNQHKILTVMEKSFESDKNKSMLPKPKLEQLKQFQEILQAVTDLRTEGKQKFQEKQYQQACEIYDKAIKQYGKFLHPKLMAILYCNKGAALMNEQNYIQAAVECLKAVALDSTYHKAYHSLSSIYTALRMHEMAGDMLSRVNCAQEAIKMQSLSQIQPTPNYFGILGLEKNCTDNDVKKGYRRLALVIHPDKVLSNCQFSTQLVEQGCLKSVDRGKVENNLKNEFRNLFTYVTKASEKLETEQGRQQIMGLLLTEEGRSQHPQGRPHGYPYTPQPHMYARAWNVTTGGNSSSARTGYNPRYPHFSPRQTRYQRRNYKV